MTLQAGPAPLIEYVENGVTLTHAVPFQFKSKSEIVCTRVDPVTTVETVLREGTHYSVTGGGGFTGSVTKTSAGTSGTIFRIRRITSREQDTSYGSNDSFPSETHEAALDRLAQVDQELEVDLDLEMLRTLRVQGGYTVPELPLAPDRVGKLMRWSALDGLSVTMLSIVQLAQELVSPLVTLLGSAFKGDPGSPGEGYSTRDALALAGNAASPLDDAYLTEGGRRGKFVFYSAALYAIDYPGRDLEDDVAADTERGVFIPKQSDATGAGGAWVRANFNGTCLLEWFGAGEGATGEANRAALECAWDLLKDHGGAIVWPICDQLLLDNTTLDASTKMVTIHHHPACRIQPANPVAGTWMLDYGDDNDETVIEIYGIWVDGQVDPALGQASTRFAFNGIRVGNTNKLVFWNANIRYVDGCGCRLMRPHNSLIQIKTYRSGHESAIVAEREHSFWLSGNPTTDEAFNDVTLGPACASEKDYRGWLVEGGTILRGTGMIKLHGSQTSENHAMRALQIHCVLDYDLEVKTTLGYSGPGFIHISDAGSGDGIVPKEDYAALQDNCRGRLTINNHHNVSVVEPGGVTYDMVTIDLGTAGSMIVVDGLIKDQLAPQGTSDYRQIGLAAPGQSGARIDLAGLRTSMADTTKLIDDRRTLSSKRNMQGAASPTMLIETARKVTAPLSRVVGEQVAINFPGVAGENPPLRLLGVAYDDSDQGLRFSCPLEPIQDSFHGTIDPAVTPSVVIIGATRPLIGEDASGNPTFSYLRRVMVVGDIGSGDDAVNHWELDIYRMSGVFQTLQLIRGTLTAAPGDGLPDFVSASSGQGACLDFWTSLDEMDCGKMQTVGAVLRAVGTPGTLNWLKVKMFWEIAL